MSALNILPHKQWQPVPIFMIRYFLGNGGKKLTTLRLYLYLNIRSNGCINITRDVKRQIMTDLNLKESTVNKHLVRLNELGWVRRWKPNHNRYYIDGFDKIRLKMDASPGGVVLNLSKILQDAQLFKARIIGAFIINIVQLKNKKFSKGKLSPDQESLYGGNASGSVPRFGSLSACYWPVASNYLVKALSISKATAVAYRKLAQEYGFIEVRVTRRPITRKEEAFRKHVGGEQARMIRYRKDGTPTIDLPHFIRCNQKDTEKAYYFRCLSKRCKTAQRNLSIPTLTDFFLESESSTSVTNPFLLVAYSN